MGTEKNIYVKIEDEKDIEKLCSITWETLYRFVYFKVQNREEAEDITQETYIKAISYMKKDGVTIDRFISFLKTVSLNIIRDKWRKNKRQGKSMNIDDLSPGETALKDSTEDMGQHEMIKDALMMLNQEQRTVIDLRLLKGYSVADTAKNMGKTEGNVRVLQYRAIQNLSKILKNEN